jgi:hypothetical protein
VFTRFTMTEIDMTNWDSMFDSGSKDGSHIEESLVQLDSKYSDH